MFKNLSLRTSLFILLFSTSSCATSVKWEGDVSQHISTYMQSFDKFRSKICVPKAESIFDQNLLAYRGQGYWIPELEEDVDTESIKSLLSQMEKKLNWIRKEKESVKKNGVPSLSSVNSIKQTVSKLLVLKKSELEADEKKKTLSRQESLRLLKRLVSQYDQLIQNVSFLSSFQFPVDHLKNRKVYDSFREKSDIESKKIANYTFLYRKLLEDGAYNKNHTGSDIYLRTTIDTLFFELKQHGFYLSEDARYDLDFVLNKIESELSKGKERILERLTEWEERTHRTYEFYKSLTLPENQVPRIASNKNSTPNRELIKEHNRATDRLKEFVYSKQAEVYNHWLHQTEITRAVFVIETILMNEVGGVDGEDALERMDVAKVVLNRMDKPKYLAINKNEFIYPYLKKVTSDFHIKNEKWLNALFKQGEFSFTYYYMSGVAKIFCPDMAPAARKLRKKNIEIAFQVLKENDNSFKATRYFSRASMIGRIHMDSIWEDYEPYPERAGLLADGQKKLLKAFSESQYSFLYSFEDPQGNKYQVLQIKDKIYALGEKNGLKLFYNHRNPHYFRYFTKMEGNPSN